MAAVEEDAAAALARYTPQLWLLAVLLFGVGDLATTATGFLSGRAVEVGPVVAPLVERHGAGVMVLLKLGVFGACVALWRLSPSPARVGVPAGAGDAGRARHGVERRDTPGGATVARRARRSPPPR